MEIERKWLLKSLPIFSPSAVLEALIVRQRYLGYLRTRGTYSRITGEKKYYLNVKSEGHLSRQEWETEIPEWAYNLVFTNSLGNDVFKDIIKIRVTDVVVELHIYYKQHQGLLIMECEFPDEAAALNWQPPDWIEECIDREVTSDNHFRNSELAKNKTP